MHRSKSFTLIELIIVVIIVAILAVTAIPRYFANIEKAKRSQVFVNLDAIRQTQLAYYATYGAYKSSFPISVVLEGETVMSISDPSNSSWSYVTGQSSVAGCAPNWYVYASKLPGGTCIYWMCVSSGDTIGGTTCTP